MEGFYKDSTAPSNQTFAGAEKLKEVWISIWEYEQFVMTPDTFAGVENDLNVYFFEDTFEEVVAKFKAADWSNQYNGDEWFTNASEKVHFYFKDTIPADVEWPEELKSAE